MRTGKFGLGEEDGRTCVRLGRSGQRPRAGIYYEEEPEGFPPLLEGRYFTPSEIEQDAPGALVGRSAGSYLVGGDVQVGQTFSFGGREWTVVGIVGDELPATGYAFAYGTDYVWIPLSAFHRVVNAQDEAKAQLYLKRTPSEEIETTLHQIAAKAVTKGDYDLYYANQRLQSSERYFTRLVEIGVGVVATLYGALNLFSLMSYWIARRRYELEVRRCIGATARDLVRMVFAEQTLLVGISYVIAAAVFIWVCPVIRNTGLKVVSSVEQIIAAGALDVLMLGITQFMAMRLWSRTTEQYLGR